MTAQAGDALTRTFEVQDISDWVVMSQEARGLDPKDWVARPDEVGLEGQAHWWLFKPIKVASYRRYDDWAEKLSSELARLLELPSARVELARRQDEQGIISANVTPVGWTMESGDTMLSEIQGYISCATDERPSNRFGHSLINIGEVLDGRLGPPGTTCEDWTPSEVFAGYLVFDAWVANTDRHAINWGVLAREEDGRQALAASFDHGSALASGTQDDRLRATTPEHYSARGFAHRFENGTHLPLADLARESVRKTGGRAALWLERLGAVEDDVIERVLISIPGMSELRRRFLSSLLLINRRRLTS